MQLHDALFCLVLCACCICESFQTNTFSSFARASATITKWEEERNIPISAHVGRYVCSFGSSIQRSRIKAKMKQQSRMWEWCSVDVAFNISHAHTRQTRTWKDVYQIENALWCRTLRTEVIQEINQYTTRIVLFIRSGKAFASLEESSNLCQRVVFFLLYVNSKVG